MRLSSTRSSYLSAPESASGAALTSDQLEEIREAFKLFDTDDSGTIDSDGA